MSMADPIDDWCTRWAYGVCGCERMCPDDAQSNANASSASTATAACTYGRTDGLTNVLLTAGESLKAVDARAHTTIGGKLW